jgi:glycosyltransferase 2 family protein
VKKLWNTSWRIALCAILLFWIFHAIFVNEAQGSLGRAAWERLSRGEQWRRAWEMGPRSLWQTLTLVRPAALVLSVLAMGATIVLGVFRWRLALRVQGIQLSVGRAMEISFVAHFFNSFLLGSTGGDLMKAYYAARETHHKKTEAVVTVFVDRLVGLWAMLLFAGLMMLANLELLFDHRQLRLISLLSLALLAAGSLFVALAFRSGVSRRWAGARTALRRLPKGEWLERSLDSCREFGRAHGYLSRALAISMLLNALCVVQVWILSRALSIPVPPLALFVLVPTIICVSAVPVTPSGLGVRENLYVFMLSATPFLAEPARALSLSLLAYAGSLFWSIVGGAVYVMFKGKHHLAETELARADDAAPDRQANSANGSTSRAAAFSDTRRDRQNPAEPGREADPSA